MEVVQYSKTVQVQYYALAWDKMHLVISFMN